jgi:hypothetical protein
VLLIMIRCVQTRSSNSYSNGKNIMKKNRGIVKIETWSSY